MSVKVIINEILRKRHESVNVLEMVQRNLDEFVINTDNLLEIAGGGGAESLPEFTSVTEPVSTQLKSFQEEISQLRDSLSKLIRRFKRKTVNIGVAGKARQGKSTLLQSISALNNTVIPTSDELPCTGTKSKIFHQEEQTYAKIDFYTESEFLKEIVHSYFDLLKLPKPLSLKDFSGPLPQPDDQVSEDRNLYNAIYERMKMIHDAFPAFRECLSKPPEMIGIEKISDYVTQGRGRIKYLAVKTANIYTKFPHLDVSSLCLVDLPGLEAAQGHERKLADSLGHEVDAVILVKLPSPQGTQYDKDDFKVIDLIDHAAREVELADWLFIVLNRLNDSSNEKQIQLLKENPPRQTSRFNILTADCSDQEEVEKQVFSQVLKHLEQHLEQTDRKYVKTFAEKMSFIFNKTAEILMISQSCLKPQQEDRRMQREYERKVIEFIKGMKQKIYSLTLDTYNMQADMGSEFKLKVEEICKQAEENAIIPGSEELTNRYKEEGSWTGAVQDELHYIRAALSKFLADEINTYLDQLVTTALKKVLDGIFKDALHRILPSVSEDSSPLDIIKDIQKLFDADIQEKLHEAFDYITKFNFSYHSHFHHRVRKNMSMLDTYDDTYGDRFVPKGNSDKSLDDIAQEIERGLRETYKETIYQITKKLSEEMQTDPANAIFSLVEEIGDRLVRQKDIEFEWRDFLYQVRGSMWPETFSQFDHYAALQRNWQDASSNVLKSIEQVKSGLGKFGV